MSPNTPRRAQILKADSNHIELAVRILKQGGVVAMPTETVYGLAGNAFDPSALSKIFLTKERPNFDPLIVHVALEKYTLADLMREQLIQPNDLSDDAIKRIDLLIRKYWPGPLTLVLPKSSLVPDLATSGLPSVAIRAPEHPIARQLIRELGLPLCAPSANRFGRISPTSSQDVFEELGDRIDVILEGGPCRIGLESTILKISEDGEAILLRPGAISKEELENTLRVPVLDHRSTPAEGGAVLAPGLLASHYAPNKKLALLPNLVSQMMAPPTELPPPDVKKVGLLALSGDPKTLSATLTEILEIPVLVEVLSPDGNWEESARNLFSSLRRLDASEADYLFAEPVPAHALETEGLAFAIADRLKKAAGPRS